MNKQEKTPVLTREIVNPSLDTFRRDVEKEEKREDDEASGIINKGLQKH